MSFYRSNLVVSDGQQNLESSGHKFLVMDDNSCMVDISRAFLHYSYEDSCGKCPPCRVGTKRMLELLDKFSNGEAEYEDIDRLLNLAKTVKVASTCKIGQNAPNPVISSILNFRDEYVAHAVKKSCPAGVCEALSAIVIDKNLCKGCTLCTGVCPVKAINGKVKETHVIDSDKCIKCESCLDKCPFKAIYKK